MKILIVEDETAAFDNLVAILAEIDPGIEISANTESISQTIKWLQTHQNPDLIIMDIHLSDGSAFSIFNQIALEIPVIFTTAYDKYAIDAFKVNSIDYLLKPIKIEELQRALEKFKKKWTRQDVLHYLEKIAQFNQASNYRDKLLIPVKDQLLPVNVDEISFIYTSDRNTRIYLKNGCSYSYSRTLDHLSNSLNPSDFIRANKQFIIARDSVKNITIWFDNRLLITMDIEPPEQIYVSKNKAAEFKTWIARDQLKESR